MTAVNQGMEQSTASGINVTTASEWRNSWMLPFASAAGMSLGMLHVYSLGTFMGPIEQEFGWGRGDIAAGLTITSVIGALFAPFVGRLIDRYGCRAVGLPGVILFLLCSLSVAFVGPHLMMWFAVWTFIGLSKTFVRPMVWTAAVASRFEKSRGLALAIALCGTSFASTFAPISAKLLIDEFGWRGGYIGISLLWAIICLPLLYFFFYDARDLHKKNGVTVTKSRKEQTDALPGATVREGIQSWAFVKLGLATLFLAIVVIGLTVHLVPLLTDSGLDRTDAAVIAGIVGIISTIGRISIGIMLDRWHGALIGGLCALLPIITVLLLLFGDTSVTIAVLAVCCLGVALGAELDVIAYLATRYFGLRNYGTIFGLISSLMVLGTGLGPMLTGIAYDIGGNYNLALIGCIPLCLLSALALATMGRYPTWDKD